MPITANHLLPVANDAAPAASDTRRRQGARMDFRLTDEVQDLIKRASEMTGRSMTDFVVSAATAAAQETIERTQVIRMTLEGQKRFAEALMEPAEPNAALVRAFKRRRELMGGE